MTIKPIICVSFPYIGPESSTPQTKTWEIEEPQGLHYGRVI